MSEMAALARENRELRAALSDALTELETIKDSILRDSFATAALQGMFANNWGSWRSAAEMHQFAVQAYLAADAMLKVRE